VSQNEQTLQKLEEAKDMLFNVFPKLKNQSGVGPQPQSLKGGDETSIGTKKPSK